MTQRLVTESDLVIPSLIALIDSGKAGLSTSELQPVLRAALNPRGDDLRLLAGRTDDRFSQKVRNLRSHSRLERDGLADFDGNRYHVTDAGIDYVELYLGVDASFGDQGFGEAAKSAALAPSRPIKFVEEGNQTNVSAKIRRRSKRLREFALIYFADEYGKIACHGCGFEATTVYGEGFLGLIEIHHTKPIALEGGTIKPLREAVASLSPLCPTCHRVVHKNQNEVMEIAALRELILSQ